jgi:uncharacterized protein YjbI with pentapeptide repeats
MKKIENEDYDFKNHIFLKKANFGNVKFTKEAYFTSAIFLENADFSGSIFKELSYFINVNFANTSIFSGSVFNKNSYFTRSIFKNRSNFIGSTFKSKAYFGMLILKYNFYLNFEYSNFDNILKIDICTNSVKKQLTLNLKNIFLLKLKIYILMKSWLIF